MSITATELTDTLASAFDVELHCYAGFAFADLDLSAFTSGVLPSLDGWTDVSDLISYNGNLIYERAGNSLRWRATLRGVEYDEALFGVGRAILCTRRLTADGVQTADWGLWFIGQIIEGESSDDTRHAGPWQRSVAGTDSLLERANAPRLTAGPVNLASGASVTASSTLATPELEAGNGEFAGSTANVDADNAVDGSLNSVWIAEDAPSVTGEEPDYEGGGGLVVDKIFLAPITGWDQAKLWWFELLNRSTDTDLVQGVTLYLKNQDDVWFSFKFCGEDSISLAHGERVIICASRADFEAYTGGARGATQVFEAKSWPRQGQGTPAGTLDGTPFVLDPETGWIQVYKSYGGGVTSAVAWDQAGADPGIDGWTGGAVDVSTLPLGQAIRRKPTGTDSGTAADWAFEPYYEPGGYRTVNSYEALMLEPAGQDAALSQATDEGASTLHLTSTTGFPDSGDGICEADDFAYTGRTSSALTGVSGLASSHAQGARVYPLLDGVAMTGWPCARTELLRRSGLPTLADLRIYIQQTGETTPRMPDEAGWESDWDSVYLDLAGLPTEQSDISFSLLGPDGTPRWVRRMLLVINAMSDDGRAKLNEWRLLLAQTQIDESNDGDLDGLMSSALAYRLLITEYGLPALTFQPDLVTIWAHGQLGSHSLALAPYTTVLDDLARTTGCCCWYDLEGKVDWRPDPWWPIGTADSILTSYATLGAEHLRGQVRWAGQKPLEGGVRVRARSADGLRQYTAVFPPGADLTGPVLDVEGYVVTSARHADFLAEALYAQNGLNDVIQPRQLTFVLRGIGEWLTPDLWLSVVVDQDTGQVQETADIGTYGSAGYLVERVTWEWSANRQGERRWTATAECRRFRR